MSTWDMGRIAAEGLVRTLKPSGEAAAADTAVGSVARFLTVLVIFVLVLAITYLTTRFVARNQAGKLKGGNIDVVETMQVAPGRYLQIVRLGKRYAAIAVGKETVSFLMELSEEDVQTVAQGDTPTGFADILGRLRLSSGAAKTDDGSHGTDGA